MHLDTTYSLTRAMADVIDAIGSCTNSTGTRDGGDNWLVPGRDTNHRIRHKRQAVRIEAQLLMLQVMPPHRNKIESCCSEVLDNSQLSRLNSIGVTKRRY